VAPTRKLSGYLVAAVVARLNEQNDVVRVPGPGHAVQYSPIRLLEVKA